MQADRIAASLQHRTLRIVVEQDTWNALPCFEGGDVSAQEILHASVEEEAQEDLARAIQDHHERHQRTACPTDLEMPEMSPVNLCLFAGADPPGQLRRSHSPESQKPADHRVAVVVNRDASLFLSRAR
jgi:hypothetical protein